MGYTHYFDQQKHATPEQWKSICEAFNQMRTAALITEPLPIQLEDDHTGQPLVDDNFIRFNGIGRNGHETMVLNRTGRKFQFCKTAQKPYDAAVTATLIIAHHFAPDVWDIASDGDRDDWIPGLALVKRVLPDAVIPI